MSFSVKFIKIEQYILPLKGVIQYVLYQPVQEIKILSLLQFKNLKKPLLSSIIVT